MEIKNSAKLSQPKTFLAGTNDHRWMAVGFVENPGINKLSDLEISRTASQSPL